MEIGPVVSDKKIFSRITKGTFLQNHIEIGPVVSDKKIF